MDGKTPLREDDRLFGLAGSARRLRTLVWQETAPRNQSFAPELLIVFSRYPLALKAIVRIADRESLALASGRDLRLTNDSSPSTITAKEATNSADEVSFAGFKKVAEARSQGADLRGSDLTGAIVLFVVRDRLAQSAGNLASDTGRIALLH